MAPGPEATSQILQFLREGWALSALEEMFLSLSQSSERWNPSLSSPILHEKDVFPILIKIVNFAISGRKH